MHYFIIHSGSDYDSVHKLLDKWSSELTRFKCSVLIGTQNDWYDDARAGIRGAEKIISILTLIAAIGFFVVAILINVAK